MSGEKRKYGYRTSRCTTGVLSIKIRDEVLSSRLNKLCKLTNTSCTEYVEKCIKRYLEEDQKAYLADMSKEELIELVIKNGVLTNGKDNGNHLI